MEYLYTQMLDDPHEICMWAKEDVAKAYKDSIKKAIKDVSHAIAKRQELNKEASILADKLKAAHDKHDMLLVSDVLSALASNIRGELRDRRKLDI